MLKIMNNKVSIIIPALNEEKNIQLLTEKIFKNLKKIKFEIIFVDDNSNDQSKLVLLKLSNKYPNGSELYLTLSPRSNFLGVILGFCTLVRANCLQWISK